MNQGKDINDDLYDPILDAMINQVQRRSGAFELPCSDGRGEGGELPAAGEKPGRELPTSRSHLKPESQWQCQLGL